MQGQGVAVRLHKESQILLSVIILVRLKQTVIGIWHQNGTKRKGK